MAFVLRLAVSEGTVLKHFLFTRFNVVSEVGDKNRSPGVDWLRYRLKIFNKVTIPSIRNQIVKPDHWFILLDTSTPDEIRAEIDFIVASANLNFCKPCYIPFFNSAIAMELIKDYLCSSDEWLLTTRLDNDDALHPRFLESVKSSAVVGTREFINIPQGLIIANGKAYRKRDYSNAFVTLSEPVAKAKSVWVEQHHRVARHAPIKQVLLRDGWIQFVHGGNIANQVRGFRATYKSIDQTAVPEHLMKQVLVESSGELIIDNSIGLVQRYSGSARRLLKTKWRDSFGN